MDFIHSGDFGDIVYCLPVIRACGRPPGTFFLVDRDYTKVMSTRAHCITPLLESQGFKVVVGDPPKDSKAFDISRFRGFHSRYSTLVEAQAKYAAKHKLLDSFEVDTSPWLDVEPSPASQGCVVMARSPRYNNPMFPWKALRELFRDKKWIFVGSPEEFERCPVDDVEYFPTKDLLEVAELISGCDLFVGNQSSPFSLAVGLGKDAISEVSPLQPDCIFSRSNIQYVLEYLSIPGRGTIGPDLDIILDEFLPEGVVPSGGWTYPVNGVEKRLHTLTGLSMLARVTPRAVREWMLKNNKVRVDEKWKRKYSHAHQAFKNAGLDFSTTYLNFP
jgi:hypothetical protein